MPDFPSVSRELVQLEHPYSRIVREAVTAAYHKVQQEAYTWLVQSAFSPIPKDTGYLRSQTQMNLMLTAYGVELTLRWPVHYAQYLIEHAGEWQFRHPSDPVAVGDFPEPAMEMVWRLFYIALLQELSARGVDAHSSGYPTMMGLVT